MLSIHFAVYITAFVASLANALSVPSCAETCFLAALSSDGCSSLTDFSCACQNTDLVSTISDCISTSTCTASEEAEIVSAIESECDSVGHPVSIPASITSTLSGITVTSISQSSSTSGSVATTSSGSATITSSSSSASSTSTSSSSSSVPATTGPLSRSFTLLALDQAMMLENINQSLFGGASLVEGQAKIQPDGRDDIESSANRMLRGPFMNDKKSITDWVDRNDKSGEFKRQVSSFRDSISTEPGAKFPPEKGRYHLYVSYACPWAHRALIVRKLKGLEDFIDFTSVHWEMLEKGWRFATPEDNVPGENVRPDPIHPKFTHLRDIYFEQNPDYNGRFTVPTLYDTKTSQIVNNESSEIIRMLYYSFDSLLPEDSPSRKLDLYPESHRVEIHDINEWTYNDINNGVYKSGFATAEDAYTRHVHTLFSALDRAEAQLRSNASKGPYYLGSALTELDVRLYTTIIRFDPVYVQHFKCNIRDIRSGYPYLHNWLRNLYWNHDAFGSTTNFEHIKNHYTKSHKQINPFSITPVGPEPNILPLGEEVEAVKIALAMLKGELPAFPVVSSSQNGEGGGVVDGEDANKRRKVG